MSATRTLSPEAIIAECDRRMISLILAPGGQIVLAGHDIPPALPKLLNDHRDTFAPLIERRRKAQSQPATPRVQALTPEEAAAFDAELAILGEEIEAQLLSDALEISEADAVLLRVQRWFCAAGTAWLTEQEIGERRRDAGLPFQAVVEAVYELVERGQLLCCTTYGAPRFRLARPDEFRARREGRLGDVYARAANRGAAPPDAAPVGAGAAGVADSGTDEEWREEF